MKYHQMARRMIVNAISNIVPEERDGPYLRSDGLDRPFTPAQLDKLIAALAVERGRIIDRYPDIEV